MSKTHIFRAKPNEELLGAIKSYCEKKGIRSGVITQLIGHPHEGNFFSTAEAFIK